jgi:hypothetical protein
VKEAYVCVYICIYVYRCVFETAAGAWHGDHVGGSECAFVYMCVCTYMHYVRTYIMCVCTCTMCMHYVRACIMCVCTYMHLCFCVYVRVYVHALNEFACVWMCGCVLHVHA